MNVPNKVRRLGGFSLVELMIAVVVGMIAVVFATRLLVRSEHEKSVAVGGSDTMQNGMLAMFQITNDANQAGWGLNDSLVLGCDTRLRDTDGFQLASVDRGGAAVTPLAPVVIQFVAGASDTISLYSGSALSGSGNVSLGDAYNGGTSITIASNNPFNFLQGDVIVVAPEPASAATPCNVAQLSSTPAGAGNVLSIEAGSDDRFNAGTLDALYARGGARIFNLGQVGRLSFHTWSVDKGVLLLRATDLAGTARVPQPVIDNVIAIKAQYGIDNGTGQVGRWTPTIDGSVGAFQSVIGIRLAVIARGPMPEKPDPATGKCSATTVPMTVFTSDVPSGVQAVPALVNLGVPNDPIDWTCYRYRAFETIIPLRNAAWRP